MQDEKKEEAAAIAAAARRSRSQGYLRNLLMLNNPGLKNKFSSTPIDPETNSDTGNSQQQPQEGAELTEAERAYLESLLQQGDATLIERATQRLCDPLLFPPLGQCNRDVCHRDASTTSHGSHNSHSGLNNSSSNKHTEHKRRDSQLQQELFRLHETNKIQPSRLLERMNNSAHRRNSILEDSNSITATSITSDQRQSSQSPIPQQHPQQTTTAMARDNSSNNSSSSSAAEQRNSAQRLSNNSLLETGAQSNLSQHQQKEEEEEDAAAADNNNNNNQNIIEDETADDNTTTTVSDAVESWNPFKDVSSWLDGSQGVEVNDNGIPLKQNSQRSISQQQLQQQHQLQLAPFRILGTTADDVSCHPHVLSPPLMESLLAFVPESLTQHNFLLKYSLVRDGANLFTLLRQIRASDITFLAIETIDGHVFGCYASQAWRLAQGWYGSKDSFLWKMRRSRLETTKSIVQQAYQESEIQVYPYRMGNVAVQYCSHEEGLTMGQGEVLPSNNRSGKHYGHGLHIDPSLLHGTTSSSETFGNPCLVNAEERGACFDVSNIEVWTLTPHQTMSEAEQYELSTMFLQGARDDKKLNLMNILVGQPI